VCHSQAILQVFRDIKTWLLSTFIMLFWNARESSLGLLDPALALYLVLYLVPPQLQHLWFYSRLFMNRLLKNRGMGTWFTDASLYKTPIGLYTFLKNINDVTFPYYTELIKLPLTKSAQQQYWLQLWLPVGYWGLMLKLRIRLKISVAVIGFHAWVTFSTRHFFTDLAKLYFFLDYIL